MGAVYNRVKVTSATAGTGTLTLGSAVSNAYLSFSEAGVPNAKQVSYVIEDGNDFEIGLGTYTSSGTTLSRDTVRISKISGTSGTTKLTCSGSQTVSIDAAAEDFNNGAAPKVVTFTSDSSLSSNQAITGVGFKPSAIFLFGTAITVAGDSAWGLTDGTTSGCMFGRGNVQTDGYSGDTNFIHLQSSSTNDCQYGLVSLDTDGFTLSRTPGGSGAGSITFRALCIP